MVLVLMYVVKIAKPGQDAAFQCKKKKEQTICNTMKDCGDNGGEKTFVAGVLLKQKE